MWPVKIINYLMLQWLLESLLVSINTTPRISKYQISLPSDRLRATPPTGRGPWTSSSWRRTPTDKSCSTESRTWKCLADSLHMAWKDTCDFNWNQSCLKSSSESQHFKVCTLCYLNWVQGVPKNLEQGQTYGQIIKNLKSHNFFV